MSLRGRNFKVTANKNSTQETIRVSTTLISVVSDLPQWLQLRIAINWKQLTAVTDCLFLEVKAKKRTWFLFVSDNRGEFPATRADRIQQVILR